MPKRPKKKQPSPPPDNKAQRELPMRIISPIIIILVGVIIYSNSLDCSFHMDDSLRIVENNTIRNIKNPGAIWNWQKLRFIGYVTFALNYHVHKLDVFGYHVVNLLIHILTSVFVYWLVLLLFSTPGMQGHELAGRKRLIALFCGLVFTAHPVQTQAITYIVQRFASLAAMFYIGSLSFYVKGRLTSGKTGYLYYVAAAFSALLGIFTKENVVTLPIAFFLIEFCFFLTGSSEITKRLKNPKIWFAIGTLMSFLLIIPFFITSNISEIFVPISSQRSSDPLLSSSVYLFTQFRVFMCYLRLMFFPAQLSVDYDFPASSSFFEPAVVLSFLFLVSLVVWAFANWQKYRLASFGILFFFCTHLIESSIKPLHNVIFEHRLYLPLLGFSLCIVSLLFQTVKKKHTVIITGVLCTVIGLFSILTYQRNNLWKSEITLWMDVKKKYPNKARSYYAIGMGYKEAGNNHEALRYLRQALEINPGYSNVRNILGLILSEQGKYEEAVIEYKKAIKLNPSYERALNNLGMALHNLGRYDEAMDAYRKARDADPLYDASYNNSGMAYYELGSYEEALVECRKAVYLNTDYADAHYNLGIIYNELGEHDVAIDEYRKSLLIDPDNAQTHNNLGNVFYQRGRLQEAAVEFRAFISLNPDYAPAYMNLGIVLYDLGLYEDALVEYRHALKLDPDNFALYYTIGDTLFGLKKYRDAIDAFNNTIRISPEFAEGYKKISEAYTLLGEHTKAEEFLQEYERRSGK